MSLSRTRGVPSENALPVQVASSATVVTLLASNPSRLGATIYNDSAAVLHVKLGAAASATSKNVSLAADEGYYEVPYGYTGIITGIWESADGYAYVAEHT